jgi:hypothetical protein
MTKDKSNTTKYGFLAQEVQQVMPSVVKINQLHRVKDGKEILSREEGEPLLMFDKDAIYSAYPNAFKELKSCVDYLKEILKNNNIA